MTRKPTHVRSIRDTAGGREPDGAAPHRPVRPAPEGRRQDGPDPLHLAEVFGPDEKTAMRCADSARALLEQSAEQHLR